MTSTLHGIVPSIIDAHIHQWDPFTTPREASRLAPLYRRAPRVMERLVPVLLDRGTRELVRTAQHAARPYLPADYARDVAEAQAAVGVPVEAAVHVQADWHGPDAVDETVWLETLDWGKGGNPQLAAIVAHADPRRPDIATALDRHAAASSRFRGIRFMTSWHPDKGVKRWIEDEGVLRSPDFLRGFAALAERSLTFDAWLYSGQLGDVAVLAREYPETTIVLDHYGSPVGALGPMGRATARTSEDRSAILAAWRDDMAEVAAHPNVVAKHSGLAFPMLGLREPGIGRAQLTELVAPLVEHTTDVFGADRLIFGSNYPMDKSIASYGTLVGALCDLLAPRGPELLAKVFRDNALRVYGRPDGG
jgi:predicted TIM-barrel fold metal-dependent hydrolase